MLFFSKLAAFFLTIRNISNFEVTMADIRPFRAWRYHSRWNASIGELTSPLFDVVSEKQRNHLYQNPLNSIHLSVPLEPNPSENATKTWQKWKNEGIVEQDEKEAIYVYYQYFRLPNEHRTYCRKGFICMFRIYDWAENVLLRHENTLPKAVNDRAELLEKTLLNSSPTHGLYADPAHELEKIMDTAMQRPIYETEDYQGVTDMMAIIDDPKLIGVFREKISSQKIILADGHHRYAASLEYQKKCKSHHSAHTGEEAYNFHLMLLTNSASDDLRILPTHRLVKGLDATKLKNWEERIEEFFTVREVDNAADLPEIISGKKWAFGVLTANKALKIRLREEKFSEMKWHFPQEVKELDLTVLHYFFIDQLLGISGKEHRDTAYLQYERNFTECLTQVLSGKAQIALITNEVEIEEIEKVCKTGSVMPPKSTFFYPKAVCGFVFASITE
jgi:uncharacterized protein (DUF1015 family)